MHLFIIPIWITYLSAAVVAVAALWKGDRPARTIAGVHLAFFIYGLQVCGTWPHTLICPWPGAVHRELFEDGVTFAVCLGFALRSDRYWTLWVCSVAALPVVNDLMAIARPHQVSGWAYWTTQIIWDYVLDISLLWGVWSADRARARLAAV